MQIIPTTQITYNKDKTFIHIEDDILPFGGCLYVIRYNFITLNIYHWDTDVINKVLKEIKAPFRVVDADNNRIQHI